jgi:RNA polymerase sigma factor (sigma-70 family)
MALRCFMDNPQQVLEENLETIKLIVKKICYRSSMQEADIEDVISYTYERLIRDDYKIIREFEGKTLPQSFLVLVVTNICKDRFRKHSGRWRPSTKATELGETACRLEKLLYRQKYSFEETIEIIETENLNADEKVPSRAEMEKIASQLKVRQRNVTVLPGDLHLTNIATSNPDYESTFRKNELNSRKLELDQVIIQHKRKMGEEEKLILKLHFSDNHNISVISRTLNKTRYHIKKSIDLTLETFKQTILKNGFDRSEIDEILEHF